MTFPSPRILLGYIAIVVSVTAIVTGIAALKQSNDLVDGLVTACETNRGPLNAYFQSQLAESKSHGVNYYRQRFPDFPPKELRDAIRKQREQLKNVVIVTDPGSCEEQYR